MRAILAGAFGLAIMAQPAMAQVHLMAFRPDMSPDEYAQAETAQTLRDQIRCREEAARDTKGSSVFVSAPGASLLGAVILGAAAGVTSEWMASHQGPRALSACMTALGYMPRDLTPAEQADSKALSGAELSKWQDRTAMWTPRPGSQTYALMMWDMQRNQPVSVRRDPATGQLLRSWSTVR